MPVVWEHVARLLDWLLDTYFEAIESLLRDVDRVEVSLRSSSNLLADHPGELVAARRRVIELRRTLKCHREIFHALLRLDFTANGGQEDEAFFVLLHSH